MIKRLFVSGYRSYELGIFSEDDDKLFFVKEFFEGKSQPVYPKWVRMGDHEWSVGY